MKMTTIVMVLPLIFIFSLSKPCLAQDWARPMESSTAPTDYQVILDRNLAAYSSSSKQVTNDTNLADYEQNLYHQLQSMPSSDSQSTSRTTNPEIPDTPVIATPHRTH